jgi:dihydroorotase
MPLTAPPPVPPHAPAAPRRLSLRRPDDWHVHLRDGAALAGIAAYTARQFARAVVMPNLKPPVTSIAAASAYRQRILEGLGPGIDFTPLMTCYLTDSLAVDEIVHGHGDGVFIAAKLYPAGATTNSEHGVTDVARIRPVLEAMQRIGMPLLVHGEVVDPEVDVFDREAVFIERVLSPLLKDFPGLRVVFEHITTAEAAAFVAEGGANLAATITPHHLVINRNAMFKGGIRPHFYCLPVAKRERHRLALRKAATSGAGRFFLGTDSAPHPVGDKEAACGCAGIFNAPFALETYATVFEEEGALDRFEAFASENGPRFYGLPLNKGAVTLERAPSTPPRLIVMEGLAVSPFQAEETLSWRFMPGPVDGGPVLDHGTGAAPVLKADP